MNFAETSLTRTKLNRLRLRCEEATGRQYSKTTSLLAGLQWFFSDGPLKECSHETLALYSRDIYRRFLHLSAHSESLDSGNRDPSVHHDSCVSSDHLVSTL